MDRVDVGRPRYLERDHLGGVKKIRSLRQPEPRCCAIALEVETREIQEHACDIRVPEQGDRTRCGSSRIHDHSRTRQALRLEAEWYTDSTTPIAFHILDKFGRLEIASIVEADFAE